MFSVVYDLEENVEKMSYNSTILSIDIYVR